MVIPVALTWHQANFQYLLSSVHRIRQILAEQINSSQASPVQIPSATTLTPEALAVLQDNPSNLDTAGELNIALHRGQSGEL
ncbi:MAG: hypothetical protein F6K47_41315 [Symploca sp. SIO2E6]|nr:hypothetical protein [Symploca sp. SIO2E6]